MPNIRINDMRLLDVHFTVNEQFTEMPDGIEFRFKYDLESHYEETENMLIVKMKVSTHEESDVNYPFYFDLRILGLFDIDASIDNTLVDQLSKINCPAMLFPYLREAVSDLTRRAGFPPLYLPVVNFLKEARKEQELNKSQNQAKLPKLQTNRRRRSKKAGDSKS